MLHYIIKRYGINWNKNFVEGHWYQTSAARAVGRTTLHRQLNLCWLPETKPNCLPYLLAEVLRWYGPLALVVFLDAVNIGKTDKASKRDINIFIAASFLFFMKRSLYNLFLKNCQ